MPWKETHVEEERMRFIVSCLDQESDWPMSEVCRAFGISRKTGYKWLERYDSFGLEGLKDHSRAPKTQPHGVSAAMVERVLKLRRRHRFWGPRKLVAWLRREEPAIAWPAPSTTGEILKRHGLVRSRRRRRRAVPQGGTGLCQPAAANDQWSADFKGWFRTGDGQRCDPLTIADGFSRFLLRCRVVEQPDDEHSRPVFRSTFREYGLPLALRTDNGPPFASTQALGGLTRLSVWWVKLGITLERIEPGHPQQNGRHERMHETLKQETAWPPRPNGRAQQRAFNDFWYVYNFERPHAALGEEQRRTRMPQDRFSAGRTR
jgi:transposase InsO family protein